VIGVFAAAVTVQVTAPVVAPSGVATTTYVPATSGVNAIDPYAVSGAELASHAP